MAEHSCACIFMEAVLDTLRYQSRLVEGAVGQLSDAQVHQSIAPSVNSIAVILKHLSGNLRSRWTDFLTTDGEKPTRDRESEFVDDGLTRDAALARWRQSLDIMRQQVESLTSEDMLRSVNIRGQPHTVPRAICRALDHNAYHVGQIVLIAKMLVGDRWTHLSVPPGGSRAFNESLGYRPTPPTGRP